MSKFDEALSMWYHGDVESEYNLRKAHNADLIEKAEELASEMASTKLDEIKVDYKQQVIKEIQDDFIAPKGISLSNLSPLISENVFVDGKLLERKDFIPDSPITDPTNEDVYLFCDDIHQRWLVREKNGPSKLVSRFVVEGCLIVDASGPGVCKSFVVLLKGSPKPLIFQNGNITPASLRKQTIFHQKGLSVKDRKYYYESFIRALCMCKYVFFLTIPKHAGWNTAHDGTRFFVSAENTITVLNDIFDAGSSNNIFKYIILEPSQYTIDTVAEIYHQSCSNDLPVIYGTVLSIMSRLLPYFQDEGFIQDRLWCVETASLNTDKYFTALIQNNNHRSIEGIPASKRITCIEDEFKKHTDCTFVVRHSFVVDKSYDLEKVLKLFYKQMQVTPLDESVGRTVPVLIIDNASAIPDEFPIHQYRIGNVTKAYDIKAIQNGLGALNFCVIKYAEQNPDAIKSELQRAIKNAEKLVSQLPYSVQSSSAIMFIATAIFLYHKKILSLKNVQELLFLLRDEVTNRTTFSNAVGKILSDNICSKKLLIGNALSPPYWKSDMAFISNDGAINITKEIFDILILSQLEIPLGRNKVFHSLKAEDLCFTNPKEDLKTRTVIGADGVKNKQRFVSLSRCLLNEDAKMIVDEAIISDIYHNTNKSIDNFYAFIQHDYLNRVAGQVITDYKKINPFICVTGGPGSRKSTFLMMQALQRAMNDDTVIVLDTTNSFSMHELYEHGIPKEIVDKHFIFWDVCSEGWPVDLMDFSKSASKEEMISVIYSLLVSGTHLSGESQLSILTNKISSMLDDIYKQEGSEKKDISCICDYFDETDADEKRVYNRLKALFCQVNTANTIPQKWQDFLNYRGKIIVFSNGGNVSNADVNVMDVIFDSLYSYKDKHRENSLTVIIDEVQKMNLRSNAPLNTLLSLGRKSNISMIIASQRFSKGYDNLGRIEGYCGTKIFCRPMDNCIDTVSKLTGISEDELQMFEDGYCAVMGSIYSEYYNKNIPMKTAVCGYIYRPPELGEYKDYTEEFEQP